MIVITPSATAHHGWEVRTALLGADYEGFVVKDGVNPIHGSMEVKFQNKDKAAFFFGVSNFAAAALSASSVLNITKGFGFYKAPGDDALIFRIKDGADVVSLALGDIAADTWYEMSFRCVGNTTIQVWLNKTYIGDLPFTADVLPGDTETLGGCWAYTCNDTSQQTMTYRKCFMAQVK